ncbi:hypothetical protein [Actinomadura meyerae]|nr:hypothetical protein [Actinomadura meyerae]
MARTNSWTARRMTTPSSLRLVVTDADLQYTRSFTCVLRADAFGQASPVGDDRGASRAVVAPRIQDEPVASGAKGGTLPAEVAWPGEALKVFGANAESHPCRVREPASLLNHGVDHSANRWIGRLKVVSSVGGTELRDHVDRRSHARMTDDFCQDTPGVMAENPSADQLSSDESHACRFEALHARILPPQLASRGSRLGGAASVTADGLRTTGGGRARDLAQPPERGGADDEGDGGLGGVLVPVA